MTAINYDKFFDMLDDQLDAVDYLNRDLAVDQLLNLTGSSNPTLRTYAAETLAEWLYRLTLPAKGRDLARVEDTVTRINTYRCYPPALWQSDEGKRLSEAVEAFFTALHEHQDAVAAVAYRPISDLLHYQYVGE